ncbi:MAG: hypothetical protein IPO10_16180 [Flavobacteriales bacterium]|nr:hypothetical protein [Flavobacteriales bacterium]
MSLACRGSWVVVQYNWITGGVHRWCVMLVLIVLLQVALASASFSLVGRSGIFNDIGSVLLDLGIDVRPGF